MKPKKRVWEFKFCQMMSSSSHSPSNPSSGTGIYQIVWTLNAEVDPRFWGLWSHQNRRGAWSDAHHRDGEIIGARPRFVSAWPMARPSSGSIWKMALPRRWERAISEHVANLLEQEFNNSVNGPRRGKRRASWGGFSRWDPQNYILNVVNVWAWDSSRSGAPWTNRALKLSWFSWAHLMTSVPICVLSCKSQGRDKIMRPFAFFKPNFNTARSCFKSLPISCDRYIDRHKGTMLFRSTVFLLKNSTSLPTSCPGKVAAVVRYVPN